MEQLWAPWRVEIIERPKPAGCIFCTLPAEHQDEENLIIARGPLCFVILNRYPYNNGHLMVIPHRHASDFTSLQPAELAEMDGLLKVSIEVIKQVYRPEGFNLGMNLGAVAGAGVAEHLHWHVVPRWGGDTNFMPVVGQTKVMIEVLKQSQAKLRPAFAAALAVPHPNPAP